MTILFAYDGSESADAAMTAAGRLFGHDRPDAVVLTVWEPLLVEALRANRFGAWPPIPPDVTQVDQRAQKQAQRLAEHGARLAANAGFEARALWVADERRIPAIILEGADELDADLIVTGARGLTGIAAFFGSVSNHVLQHATRPVLVVPSHQVRTIDTSEQKEAAALSYPRPSMEHPVDRRRYNRHLEAPALRAEAFVIDTSPAAQGKNTVTELGRNPYAPQSPHHDRGNRPSRRTSLGCNQTRAWLVLSLRHSHSRRRSSCSSG